MIKNLLLCLISMLKQRIGKFFEQARNFLSVTYLRKKTFVGGRKIGFIHELFTQALENFPSIKNYEAEETEKFNVVARKMFPCFSLNNSSSLLHPMRDAEKILLAVLMQNINYNSRSRVAKTFST